MYVIRTAAKWATLILSYSLTSVLTSVPEVPILQKITNDVGCKAPINLERMLVTVFLGFAVGLTFSIKAVNSLDHCLNRFCNPNHGGNNVVHGDSGKDLLPGRIVKLAMHLRQMVIPFEDAESVLDVAPSRKVKLLENGGRILLPAQSGNEGLPFTTVKLKANDTKCDINLAFIVPGL